MHSHDTQPGYEQQLETEVRPETPEELVAILRNAGVPVDAWDSKKSNKSPEHLFGEIHDGDSVLVQIRETDESGIERERILRKTSVIWINVYGHDQNDQRWKLREQRREFNDGRAPDERTLPASLGEKGKVGKALDEEVARALEEELQISKPLPISFTGTEQLPVKPSPSYPGLPTQAVAHYFDIEFPARLVSNEGHVAGFAIPEHDKTTYFVWESAPVEPKLG